MGLATTAAMARIDIREDTLVVTIEGWHKLLALKHKLEVPLANVRGARVRPEMPKFDDADFRGTYVPGKVVAGTSRRTADGVVFCDVENPANAIAIDLVDGDLKHIFVELSNVSPEEAVAHIEAARKSLPTPGALATNA